MEQKVRVRNTFADGTAEVLCIRESACSGDCHKCSGCGAAQESLLLTAQNQIGAGVGDLVIIRSASGPVLAAAAVLYMIPLVLFLLGYFLGSLIGLGPLAGCLAFGLGIGLVILYDRRIQKKKGTIYTIIRYAE